MGASAGRILIIPKGNYNSSVTYEMLDLVYHNGTSWLAKKTVVGIEPSEANGEYWHNLIDLTTTLAALLGGYKIFTVNLSGYTDGNGFFVETNIPCTTDILSCKLLERSGFCVPYNNAGGVWSFGVEDWEKKPIVDAYVNIKVICATDSN